MSHRHRQMLRAVNRARGLTPTREIPIRLCLTQTFREVLSRDEIVACAKWVLAAEAVLNSPKMQEAIAKRISDSLPTASSPAMAAQPGQ